jgi:hypothetical protein
MGVRITPCAAAIGHDKIHSILYAVQQQETI